MGLNPFGEESDSLHAWKERYKQQKFQIETLQSQMNDKKTALQQLQVKFEEVSRQLRERDEEVAQYKKELKEKDNFLEKRDRKIDRLKSSSDYQRIERLEKENSELSDSLEMLQSRMNRLIGDKQNNQPTSSSNTSGSTLSVSLIPFMLYQFDPEVHNYEDAFINLVETVIAEGDEMAKIVAILIKYGGSGPIVRIREMVGSSQFDTAIQTLEANNVINQSGNQINISTKSNINTENLQPVSNTTTNTDEINMSNKSVEQLFDDMIELAKSASRENTIASLKDFRDELQTRDIPLTTIFFEIRKMIERIQKDKIDRNDLQDQIRNWKEKYQRLS